MMRVCCHGCGYIILLLFLLLLSFHYTIPTCRFSLCIRSSFIYPKLTRSDTFFFLCVSCVSAYCNYFALLSLNVFMLEKKNKRLFETISQKMMEWKFKFHCELHDFTMAFCGQMHWISYDKLLHYRPHDQNSIANKVLSYLK